MENDISRHTNICYFEGKKLAYVKRIHTGIQIKMDSNGNEMKSSNEWRCWFTHLRGLWCWYCWPPVLKTFCLIWSIVCNKCGNSFIFVTAGCCSTYCGFSSLKKEELKWKFNINYSLNKFRGFCFSSFKFPISIPFFFVCCSTYMWSALVCSRAAVSWRVSSSSFAANKRAASSATRGWKSIDFFDGVPSDDSDIGSSLSTKNQRKIN